jgi:hypothetical protein
MKLPQNDLLHIKDIEHPLMREKTKIPIFFFRENQSHEKLKVRLIFPSCIDVEKNQQGRKPFQSLCFIAANILNFKKTILGLAGNHF